jgi:hypothetical protein
VRSAENLLAWAISKYPAGEYTFSVLAHISGLNIEQIMDAKIHT